MGSVAITDLRSAQNAEGKEQRTNEQAWEDWWRSDRLDAAGWAAIFLWGALVVVATYTDFRDDFDWWDGWAVFFAGAGVIVLIEAMFRLMTPQYRSKFG